MKLGESALTEIAPDRNFLSVLVVSSTEHRLFFELVEFYNQVHLDAGPYDVLGTGQR